MLSFIIFYYNLTSEHCNYVSNQIISFSRSGNLLKLSVFHSGLITVVLCYVLTLCKPSPQILLFSINIVLTCVTLRRLEQRHEQRENHVKAPKEDCHLKTKEESLRRNQP